MRDTWLILIGAAIAVSAASPDTGTLRGGITTEFSVTDSPCGYKHDPSVEKALQVVAVTVNAAKPPKTGSVATLELRNGSEKTITAYVFSYTVARAGRTDHYGAIGKELVYEMALARYGKRPASPSSSFLPGEAHKAEIWGGRLPGRVEIYPCMVAFDDGTGIGPPSVLTLLISMRSEGAKSLGALIAELEMARDSEDPRTTLMLRAKRLKRISTGRPGPHVYLEAVASQLSGGRNTPLDRKVVTDHISALRAQQNALLEQSTAGKPR